MPLSGLLLFTFCPVTPPGSKQRERASVVTLETSGERRSDYQINYHSVLIFGGHFHPPPARRRVGSEDNVNFTFRARDV